MTPPASREGLNKILILVDFRPIDWQLLELEEF
jgi:hypothetical protein